MVWIALINDGPRPTSLSDTIRQAIAVAGVGAQGEVTASGRDSLEPGMYCDVYEISSDLNASVEDILAANQLDAHCHKYRYRAGCAEGDIVRAEAALGAKIPTRWAEYLSGASVFDSGWLDSGDYATLYAPDDIIQVTDAYYYFGGDRRGAIMIGDSGGSDWFQVNTDLGDQSPVVLFSSQERWEDAPMQTRTIGEFVELIDSRSYSFMHG